MRKFEVIKDTPEYKAGTFLVQIGESTFLKSKDNDECNYTIFYCNQFPDFFREIKEPENESTLNSCCNCFKTKMIRYYNSQISQLEMNLKREIANRSELSLINNNLGNKIKELQDQLFTLQNKQYLDGLNTLKSDNSLLVENINLKHHIEKLEKTLHEIKLKIDTDLLTNRNGIE